MHEGVKRQLITASQVRRHRGTAALKTAARVVLYEYWMFKEGLRWLVSLRRSSSASNQVFVNAAIEVTLIHARKLLDFFTIGGRSNDIKMRDFLTFPPRIALPYLRKNRKRINRKLAHTSYSNSRMSSSWDFREIETEINSAMQSFLDRLKRDEPRLCKLFEGL